MQTESAFIHVNRPEFKGFEPRIVIGLHHIEWIDDSIAQSSGRAGHAVIN